MSQNHYQEFLALQLTECDFHKSKNYELRSGIRLSKTLPSWYGLKKDH